MALARSSRPERRSDDLVERDEALASLRRCLDEAATGHGRIVLVRGTAGIGKTALLKAFVREASSRVEVLWGACDGVSTPQPYGPFDDFADALAPDLRRLLDGGASRGEIGRWLLGWMAVGPTRAVVIEDVQWGDQATLDLLAFLARRIDELPVLLLISHRDSDDDAPNVERILGGVASLPVLRQLPLDPLSPSAVEQLVGDSGIDAGALHRITAGNPFYVHEVLDTGLSRIPVSVRDVVRARTALLDERGKRALQVAAVLGVRPEPWLLAAVAGEDVLGIDDCVRVGLLTKTDGLAFAHELTRMVVLEDLPVIHGIALHRRALAALEVAGTGDAARLAYHAEGAADREAVLRHAPLAGHRALALTALQEAVAQFERALRFADGSTDAARAELFEALSRALHLLSRRSDAYDAGSAAVTLRQRGSDHLATAASLTGLAEIAYWAGHPAEALAAAREAIALAEGPGEGRELAMAQAMLGRLEMLEGQVRDSRADSERALAAARRAEDAEATAIALGTIGSVKLDVSDPTGWRDLAESARVGRAARMPWLVDRALHNAGVAAVSARRFSEAREYFQQMLEHSERSQLDLCSLDSPLAEIELVLGDWDTAAARAERALAAPKISVDNRIAALLVLAKIAVRRGTPDREARLDVVRAAAAGLESVPDPLEEMLVLGEAEAAWVSGELAPIVPRLRTAHAAALQEGRAAGIGDLGLWLWRAGDSSALDDRAEDAQRLEVAGNAREAAAAWRALAMPYDAALSLASSATAADVLQAHEDLVRMGATAVAQRVARRLRELGSPVPRGPRPTTRSNPHGLTEREWEVARLLALGLSNAEIADRLVVAPKTVGHHVSAVLGKLSIRRRAEVAAAISATGGPT